MKKIENIIVHISDSFFGCAREIRNWHLLKGWKDIGYHLVILNGQVFPDLNIPCLMGSIELGRPLNGDDFLAGNEIGAHALGFNDRSIGICGIGKGKWHPSQVASLIAHCRAQIPDRLATHRGTWKEAYPDIDLEQESKKALSWLISHPKKRRSQFDRFLNSWFDNTQNDLKSREIKIPRARSPDIGGSKVEKSIRRTAKWVPPEERKKP
jgi:N-acetylmuramoyl-L-alanine amidase